MTRRFTCFGLAVLFATLLGAQTARAENEGQDDLDKATDKKLAAENVDDLAQVIDLCESALKKGLDASNTEVANNLLTGTLMQRANFLFKTIVERRPTGWPRLRVMALGDLENALKVDPKLAQAQLLVARLQALGGDHAAAVKAAQSAADLSKDNAEIQVEALVLLGGLTEDKEKQLDYLNQALKIAPNNQEALRERGVFLLLAEKSEEAVKDLQAAVKADPDNADAHEILGLALFMLKRPEEAIKSFSEAIRLSPDSALAYLRRAAVYGQVKKTKEALDDIEHVLKIDPENAAALLLRAQVHQQAGDMKAARADLDEALKGNPGRIDALEFRAILSAGSGDYRQAIEDLERLQQIAPKNSELLSQLGMLYEANKQPRKAIEKYNAALKQAPQQFLALRGRADAYLNVGKHAEAVEDYNAALKIKPDDDGVLNNLAWVLATSPDDGVRDGKRAVELGTEAAKVTEYKKAHILSTLAAGYAETGDFEKARQWSKKAVELGSDDPETEDQLKKELASYESNKPWREKQVIEENDGSARKPEANSAAKDESKESDSSASKDSNVKKE
jgi:tetratricopeptide (TPR) repeat protein